MGMEIEVFPIAESSLPLHGSGSTNSVEPDSKVSSGAMRNMTTPERRILN